ncbi:MAG TPA: hypothetical protein VGL81_24840 [Polyangiaceae bacterium]
MSHSSRKTSSLLAVGLAAAALSLGAFGCASQPTPPPVAAAPPSQAFQLAAGGVTAPQGNPEDGVQFVEQEHKDPQIQGDGPATELHPSASAKPHQ